MLRRILIAVTVVISLALNSQLALADSALDWLANQQNSTTNLLDSYEGDGSNIAYSYDQAVAVIAFTNTNDLVRAKKILDKIVSIQSTDGSWYFGYDATNGAGLNLAKDTGNNSWMVIAINYYTRKTGDTTYVNAAKKCADFFLTLQDTNTANATYGAVRGRPDVTWYSTEHNHDAYSALYYLGEVLNNQYYKDKAQLVYNWLANKMWDNTEGRFYTGHNDTRKFLDPQSWAVPNLGFTGPNNQDFTRSIPWAYNNMYLTRTFNGQTIDGFDYDATLDAIWFEGSEQMALAYELVGSSGTAIYIHSQTAKAQTDNGGIACSSGGGTLWPSNMTQNCVAATSWYVFCSQSPMLNPFKPPLPLPDTTPPVINNVMASSTTVSSAMITWITDETSDSQVYYGSSTALGSNSVLDINMVTSHTVNLTGLNSGTTYYYLVRSKDISNNLAASSTNIFVTSLPDIIAPIISNVNSSNLTTNSAAINWTTNEASDSQVEYGFTTSYDSSTLLNDSMILDHSQNLTGLNSNTIYHYRVKSKDAAGNLTITSDYVLTTLPGLLSKDYSSTGIVLTKGTSKDSYTNLNANNSAYLKIASAKSSGKHYTDWYARTLIAEAPGNVTKLTITYDGHYSASRSQELLLYNFTANTWARIDYQTIGLTDKTITYTTTNPSYISSTGEIRLRIYTTSNKSFTCYADYLKFNIEFTNGTSQAQKLASTSNSQENNVTESDRMFLVFAEDWIDSSPALWMGSKQDQYGNDSTLHSITDTITHLNNVGMLPVTNDVATFSYDTSKESWAGRVVTVNGDSVSTTDLSDRNQLKFRVAIPSGEPNAIIQKFFMQDSDGVEYATGPIIINTTDFSQEYTIDLSNANLTAVNRLFGFIITSSANNGGQNTVTFYVDDIGYIASNSTGLLTYSYQGTIKDLTGAGVSDVIATATYINNGEIKITTDSSGYYEFSSLPSSCDLAISKPGYSFIAGPIIYTTTPSGMQYEQSFTAIPNINSSNDLKIFGGQNGYINPAKGEKARIVVNPENSGTLEIKVYDLNGTLVWETSKELIASNTEIITWDGRNSKDELVASGIYIAYINGAGFKQTKKVAIIK